MASLQLTEIKKVYPSGSLALYDVNLTVEDKEFIVVTGGEKSGKSTLLRIVAGLEETTSGQIVVGDKVVNDVDAKDRNIAMLFQGDTLYPTMTVFENIAFGLRIRKAPAPLIDQRVKAIARILGLEEILLRKPKGLSAVQKQKIAFARALVREPKLYLFDDTFAGLDDDLRAEMLSVAVNMQTRMQGSFVYATKNVAEAMSIGTRVVILKDGFVQQIDTPSNLYDYPVNAFVAFLAGSPTINFIKDVTIVKEEETYFAKNQDFSVALPQKIVARWQNIQSYVEEGKKVMLGIRPEDCLLTDDGVSATVMQTEKADDGKTYADCTVSQRLSFVIPCDKEKGENVRVGVNAERLYVFDEETQVSLLSRDEGYVQTGKKDADYVPYSVEQVKEIAKQFEPLAKDKKKNKGK